MIGYIRKRFIAASHVFISTIGAILAALPDEGVYFRLRLRFWRLRGYRFGNKCQLSRGVHFLGKVELGENTIISPNCTLTGLSAGIYFGRDVMVGPNCVFVAFNHGVETNGVSMMYQSNSEAPISIGDDVWIGANTTITAGVKIGSGAVIGANAVVTKDIPERCIAAGVPARVIRYR
jgi:maltose O-acetyltransferase